MYFGFLSFFPEQLAWVAADLFYTELPLSKYLVAWRGLQWSNLTLVGEGEHITSSSPAVSISAFVAVN